MRSLELMLLAADFLAFCFLALARMRTWFLIRHASVLALVIAVAQVLAEGPRWQMAPAYLLTIVFVLLRLLLHFSGAGAAVAGTRPFSALGETALWTGLLALAIAVLLPVLVPVFGFAPSSGPYGIGTLTYHWLDASRSEVFGADSHVRRQLMVQIWYPAKASPAIARSGYMNDADAVTTAFARVHDKPAFLFGHVKYVGSNAMPAVPLAVDQHAYPVLLFLEGATGYRQMNTFQVEHLVSHGYIVVAIDQPGVAATVVFPDGHQVAGLTPAQFRATVGPSYLPSRTNSAQTSVLLPDGRTLHDRSIIPYLTQDVAFALDQLAVLNHFDSNGVLTGKLDLHRIGIFGVSLGGIVAADACRIDARLRACLIMDAAMPTEVVKTGLAQPTMWITRDAASMRLERRQTGGWPEAEIAAHQTSMRAAYDSLTGAGYFVRVPGMFQSNFADMAIWTPLSPSLGLSGPIGARRGHEIINAYSLAFFDRHLLSRPASLLAEPAQRYPDVLVESRLP